MSHACSEPSVCYCNEFHYFGVGCNPLHEIIYWLYPEQRSQKTYANSNIIRVQHIDLDTNPLMFYL